jgi:hypothetical protein
LLSDATHPSHHKIIEQIEDSVAENNRDILFFNNETIDSFPASSKRKNILNVSGKHCRKSGSPGCGDIARRKNL